MAEEKEYGTAGGTLKYRRTADGVEITGYAGTAAEITVPDRIEELPVTGIGRKAFLSRKTIRRAELPETVKRVDDWAFAYCDSLQEAAFGSREVRFGKSVFLECGNLRELTAGPEESGSAGGDDIGPLLAAAVTKMDAAYLLDLREAGSREWLEKWDARMMTVLHAPDAEGYSRQILCGEEDYGSTDLGAYLSERRKSKVRLLFVRLLHPAGIAEETLREIREYLLWHTKGCESEEAWQVILKECGERRAYYELFAEIGCFHRDNAAAVIAEIGEESPEMKAFFLRYQAEHFGAGDFFGGLEL